METVNLQDIKDRDNLFFHFTKTSNLSKIEKNGLKSIHEGRENTVFLDLENPCIFFSSGTEGLLKTIDVWIRYEYNILRIKKQELTTNKKFIPKEILLEGYEKIYKDFSERTYLQLDLIQGEEQKTSDFSFSSNDYKKEKLLESGLIPYYLWLMGPYSDWSSAKLEDWNMQTHTGEKTISPDRIKKITDSHGNSDALSVIKEIYNDNLNKGKELQIKDLDRFMKFVNMKEKSQNIEKQTNNQQLSPLTFLDKIKNFFRTKKYLHLDLRKDTQTIDDDFKDARQRNQELKQNNEKAEKLFKDKLKFVKNNDEERLNISKDIKDSEDFKDLDSENKKLNNDLNREI